MQKSLADITDAELQEVKKLSSLFFTPGQIAIMLEFEPDLFIHACLKQFTGTKRFYDAFQGGRLQGEIDLREGIIKMAKAGSSPAQTMALDLLKQSKLKLKDHG